MAEKGIYSPFISMMITAEGFYAAACLVFISFFVLLQQVIHFPILLHSCMV